MAMNRQQVFDKVLTHARAQQIKSRSGYNGFCAYRGLDDTKCFVGALIPDTVYNMGMESKGVVALFHNYYQIPLLFTSDVSIPFLVNLQRIHDNFEPPNWEAELEYFARIWDLKYTKPE